MSNLAVSWRIASRELRGGLRGMRIFLACLALGVAAIAAVGSVRTAIQEGLTAEASSLLGGDAEMSFTYRFATDPERAFMDEVAQDVSETVNFRSMAVTDATRTLVQVKGVDDLYPLYGTLETEPQLSVRDALADTGLPGILADRVLVDRLGLVPGDRITLGTQAFELRATLDYAPDAVGAGFALGPQVIVMLDALESSGLLTPGTLFDSSYRLRLPPEADLAALQSEAETQFSETGLRWRDSRNGTPGIARFIDRLGAFLVLVGLAGLAVGGIGVSAAVRSYLDGKTDTIATLKTLGAEGNTIFAVYLMQIGLMSVIGVALGLALGAGVPLLLAPVISAQLPIPALFAIYPAPLAEAALYGILAALIFTVWPLARARDIRAAGLFRDGTTPGTRWPKPQYILLTIVLAAMLVGVAMLYAAVPRLALYAGLAIAAALLVLAGSAWVTRKLAASLARSRLVTGRPSLRLALASVGGPGGETASVILSLGLGLTVLAAVGQIDTNLRTAISQDLPVEAPAYFFVDIQNNQLDGFLNTSNDTGGVGKIDTAPMLRGIITRINGQPASEVAGDHWVLSGDRGVTYSALPVKGSAITDGEWWPEDYSGPPLMSFAEEEALEMGLKLGDEVTVNILGRDITATLANFRVVEFQNMGINFIMTLNPGALAGAPHTHIATVYADEAAEAPLLRSVSEQFPNITAIRVRDGIERVTEALESLAAATRYGAAATLLTGFVVLIGAAAAGERKRVFEAAVLKTLGAERARILSSFALRSAILGGAAGLVAILAGGLASWAVMTFVMEADFRFEPVSATAIVLGGALASLLAGLGFAWRPLSTRPARVLRARD